MITAGIPGIWASSVPAATNTFGYGSAKRFATIANASAAASPRTRRTGPLTVRVLPPAGGYSLHVGPIDSLPGQIDSTIDSVAELERRALESASLHQRAIERFVLAVGRPAAIWTVLGVVACWMVVNVVLARSGGRAFDPPPFAWLELAVSVAALAMTILILTVENRLSEGGEARARLHLQISLLAERKTAKIIQLLEELRYDMPQVPNREDREAQELILATDPHEVARELERRAPSRGELS
jgi:uncharacterized membrane protein